MVIDAGLYAWFPKIQGKRDSVKSHTSKRTRGWYQSSDNKNKSACQ